MRGRHACAHLPNRCNLIANRSYLTRWLLFVHIVCALHQQPIWHCQRQRSTMATAPISLSNAFVVARPRYNIVHSLNAWSGQRRLVVEPPLARLRAVAAAINGWRVDLGLSANCVQLLEIIWRVLTRFASGRARLAKRHETLSSSGRHGTARRRPASGSMYTSVIVYVYSLSG